MIISTLCSGRWILRSLKQILAPQIFSSCLLNRFGQTISGKSMWGLQEKPVFDFYLNTWHISKYAVTHTEKDGQNTYNLTARSLNQCCRGKVISIMHSECVFVDLVIQPQRMRRIILSSVACLALLYFSALPHKRHDVRKTLLNIKCVFWFSLQLLSQNFSF